MKSVSIKFKPGTYNILRNLQNKFWYAIAEYVDNAVQSFETNRLLLAKSHASKYQFRVEISIDWDRDQIRIYDNAAGINRQNFERAFEPANLPGDTTGLHEFGMGMKTASIWLSDLWNVTSAALGEVVERSVEFDLHQVLKNDRELLDVLTRTKTTNIHFTEVTLNKLTKNAPSVHQIFKLKCHLASIYRKYIRNGDMVLTVNGERLTYKDSEILYASPAGKISGESLLWKKEIDFKLGTYSVTGFVALLSEQSTSEHNGFSLFRRGRVIEGSHDEKYRPKVLCGQVGSPRYKRLFGELELEGFEVSFNKGSFQETSEVEILMDALKIELTHKSFNLLKQGEDYRKVKVLDNAAIVAKSLVNVLEKASLKKSLNKKIQISISQIEDKDLDENNINLKSISKVIDGFEESVQIKDELYKLKMEIINDPLVSSLYSMTVDEIDTYNKIAIYTINLSHPFFLRYDQFKTEEGYKPIILIIRSLVVAEIYAPSQGTKSAGNVRTLFNHFLRNI